MKESSHEVSNLMKNMPEKKKNLSLSKFINPDKLLNYPEDYPCYKRIYDSKGKRIGFSIIY